MWTTVLDIIDVGANLLLISKRTEIQNRVLYLRSTYAAEINKSDDQIDDAKLFSLKFELRNLISVYRTAVQEQIVSTGSKSTG